jgi:subtilisin family serine protease
MLLSIAAVQILAAAAPRPSLLADSIFGYKAKLLAAEEKVSAEALRSFQADERVSTVIFMADQADLSEAFAIQDEDARGWFVYRSLTETAQATQADLKSYLSEKGIEFKSFWAANMIVADLDFETAVTVAGRSDVARIDSNAATRWGQLPENPAEPPSGSRADAPDAIEWGVTNVGAPQLWAQGVNGSGIVVGGLDTGIRWTHAAIKSKYRGWNGTTADHNYNWHDSVHSGGGVCGANTTAPCDDNGHGSHTVGTMVGDDGAGNQIGVAPGAKWIGCRNMNVGDGSPSTYAECFQFMLAPTNSAGANANPALRPHILNNSWGCPPVEGCTSRAELETIVNNLLASGIFVQTSAGNTGPNCSSVADPAAIYDGSFAAGAIDSNNALVNFSSRGPSTFYSPNLMKPNIAAPGSNVRSITRTSDTAYTNLSGTSMASPHVAGVVALLWSGRPALVRNIAATKALLQNTANPSVTLATPQTCGGVPSTQVPNNSFGYGRVDALAAFNASAPVNVTGRVLTPEGAVLRNVVVSLIDAGGNRQRATTSSFGVFTFEGVSPNASYTMTVSSRRYRFEPKTVAVGTSALTVSDFVGLQ